MFENLTVTNSHSSKMKYLMMDGKPLTFEIKDEISGACFSGTRDKLKLSLIRSEDSEYFSYLEQLYQKLLAEFKNFHCPISQQKYTKLTIDLDRSKIYFINKKYPLNKSQIKDLFESRRTVSGKVKFSLYYHDDEIFLISTIETLIVGNEILNFI